MLHKLTDSVFYVGANDHDIDLFEGQYKVPDGMAYNSYVIVDDKIAVMDTIDQRRTDKWLANLKEVLGGRQPDYLVVQHMEPDHSASIEAFVRAYPQASLVGNKKTFQMIKQFFPQLATPTTVEVEDGGSISLGKHELTFVFAPMVHWPEVMITYYSYEKLLFSADAFGKFGALDAEDEDWACEARRYYIGIVGKYGTQVQSVLAKLPALDVSMICPLHGPVLDENLDYYINLYDTWSSYRPEDEGVCICYTSVYGNTRKAVEKLRDELLSRGENVSVFDLARDDMAEAVEDAFRYDRLVLATTTYNGDIFPFMQHFIEGIVERNYQNRFVAMIENGSWGPAAMRVMKKKLENSKDITLAENNVTIKSALNEQSMAQLKALAQELCDNRLSGARAGGAADAKPQAAESAGSGQKKGWVCNTCGYVYEGESLPPDFVCPICKRGADYFSPL